MVNKLQIIFANRKDCFEKRGGDTVQMENTKLFLEKMFPIEITVCLTAEEIENHKDAKIVHIFNIQTINETNEFIKAAKKSNKKVVLSTIYWNLTDTYYVKYLGFLGLYPINLPAFYKILLIKSFNIFIKYTPSLKKRFSDYIKKGLYTTKEYTMTRKYALKEADLLLPNSVEEMELCANDFGFDIEYIKNKSVVIPNATDFLERMQDGETETQKLDLPEKYVFTAGRIDTTKNQYNIIRALFNDKDIGIVIAGRIQDPKTYNRIKDIADKRGNVFFIPQLKHSELIAIYKNALCHCLPSFYDTTGLVNLEALLCGTRIVVSNETYCPVKFYEFDNYGETCDPYDINSIRNAILKVINNNQKVELSSEYIYKISYDNVAKLTFQAYQNLLGNKTMKENFK